MLGGRLRATCGNPWCLLGVLWDILIDMFLPLRAAGLNHSAIRTSLQGKPRTADGWIASTASGPHQQVSLSVGYDPREHKITHLYEAACDLVELVQSIRRMQRRSSRRESRPGDDQVEESTGASDDLEKHGNLIMKRECCSKGRGIYLPIVSVVLWILLWSWYTAPTGLPSIAVPGEKTHLTDHQLSESPHVESPDALRPQIRLHPESYMYRESVTQYKHWTVTAEDLRPDGVLKRVYLINGTVVIAPQSWLY
jgi:hypothetical protein